MSYIITYYLPSGLFVVVSWISFLIPPDIVPGTCGLKYFLNQNFISHSVDSRNIVDLSFPTLVVLFRLSLKVD